ncbi:MAG: hypothetical protein ACRDPC_12835 [Solirubrobacteraceae bacterium]
MSSTVERVAACNYSLSVLHGDSPPDAGSDDRVGRLDVRASARRHAATT